MSFVCRSSDFMTLIWLQLCKSVNIDSPNYFEIWCDVPKMNVYVNLITVGGKLLLYTENSEFVTSYKRHRVQLCDVSMISKRKQFHKLHKTVLKT